MTKTEFSIAAAQTSSVTGDIAANAARHVKLAELAAGNGIDVVVFPELSLTGYLPNIAAEVAIEAGDDKLEPLRMAARKFNVSIHAGCPIASHERRPYIGTFVIATNGEIEAYRKRFVHADEDTFFVSGEQTVVCKAGEMRIGVAICADIHNETHPADVSKANADIYAAGVAITPTGIERAHIAMAEYAARYRFLTVMSNYSESTGGYEIGGQSAVWDTDGKLLAKAEVNNKCLVVARSVDSQWTGQVVACDL